MRLRHQQDTSRPFRRTAVDPQDEELQPIDLPPARDPPRNAAAGCRTTVESMATVRRSLHLDLEEADAIHHRRSARGDADATARRERQSRSGIRSSSSVARLARGIERAPEQADVVHLRTGDRTAPSSTARHRVVAAQEAGQAPAGELGRHVEREPPPRNAAVSHSAMVIVAFSRSDDEKSNGRVARIRAPPTSVKTKTWSVHRLSPPGLAPGPESSTGAPERVPACHLAARTPPDACAASRPTTGSRETSLQRSGGAQTGFSAGSGAKSRQGSRYALPICRSRR